MTVGSQLVAFTLWKSDVRHFLAALNLLALIGIVVYLVVSLQPKRELELKEPPNLVPFLPDEDLESKRLERVLGWSLLFAAVVAVSLPVYWLREPTRQKDTITYFSDGAVERGAVLFANAQSPEYDSATSLRCADCHGSDGGGGTARQVIDGVTYAWKAPALNTERLRFSTAEMRDIITYGRPGTPMAAWGAAGGGPKNVQSVNDLIAYIVSIQKKPEEAKKQAAADLLAEKGVAGTTDDEKKSQPIKAVATAQQAVDAAEKAATDALAAAVKALGMPSSTTMTAMGTGCAPIIAALDTDPDNVDVDKAKACVAFADAVEALEEAQTKLDWAEKWADLRTNVSDGQILFEQNCARCHTEGWSIFDPTLPNGTDLLGPPGGGGGKGGGIGFNLRDGGEIRRFGTDVGGGFQAQVDFVKAGSESHKPYGLGGLGTGRMPGFANILTDEQIKDIVGYERYCLDETSYTEPSPPCSTTPRAAPTTTTTQAAPATTTTTEAG